VFPVKKTIASTLTGTAGYFAPEVVQGVGYTTSADMWSVGCILLDLLTFTTAADVMGKERKLRIASIPTFYCGKWSAIVTELLNENPTLRMTASKLKKELLEIKAQLSQFLGTPKVCADCDSLDPKWVSLNLGAWICTECSVVHRSLGEHISKVRSLDQIDKYSLDYLKVIGEKQKSPNAIWEKDIKSVKRPKSSSDRYVREMFIRAKYEMKSFLRQVVLTQIGPILRKIEEPPFMRQ